jgi:hypothetical protein
MNETSTDLEGSVCRQVVAGRPSHVADLPGAAASTDLGFSSSRRVAKKAWAEPPQTLAGRAAPGPTWPGVWHTWSTCQIHPVVMVILTFGQLHFFIPWNDVGKLSRLMVATRKYMEIYDMQASRRKATWFNIQKLAVNNYALGILVLRSRHLLKVLTSIASRSLTMTDPQPNTIHFDKPTKPNQTQCFH